MSSEQKLHRIYAEGIHILAEEDDDPSVHITAGDKLIRHHSKTHFMDTVDLGPRAVIHEIDDRGGNELISVPSNNTVQMASTSTLDFNNCTIDNLNFNGATLDFQGTTIQNFSVPDSTLTTSQVASTNFPGSTLENELDAITTNSDLALSRTKGPHHQADRIVVTNGSAIIGSGSFAPSDIVRRTQTQNISGAKTFTTGPKIADDESITFGTSSGPVIKSHNETLVFEPKNNQTNIEFRHHSQGANEDPESMLTIQDDRVRIHAPLEMDGTNDIFQDANSGNTGVFLRLNKLETQDLSISGNKTFSGTTNFTGPIHKDGGLLAFNDIDGDIADSQITTVSASKVSGTLATTNIPALSATTAFDSGTVPDVRLPTNIIRTNVDGQTIACNDFKISAGTSGDAVLTLEADTTNINTAEGEGNTSFINLFQDGGGTKVSMGLNGDNDLFLGSVSGFFNSGMTLQTNALVKPIVFSVGLAERARVVSNGISLAANNTYQINGQQIGCGNLRANTLSEFTTGTLPTGRIPPDVLKLVGGANPAAESVIKIGTDGTQSYESVADLQTTNASQLTDGLLPDDRLSANVLQRPGDANPSGTSVVTVSSNGTQAYALTSTFGTTNASNLNSGTLSTTLLPGDVIKKPSAANPASATSVVTVDTSGTQAYATLSSLHNTAIKAEDQSTNNFDGLSSGKLFLAGPTANPFSTMKPTFRTIAEGDLPSYLGETTLSNTFYTKTILDNTILPTKQDASTAIAKPSGANPSVPSYVVVAANGTESYQAKSELITTGLTANPVIEGSSDGVFTLRVSSDNTSHKPIFKMTRRNADGSSSKSATLSQADNHFEISGSGGTRIAGTHFLDHDVEIGTEVASNGQAQLKFHANAANMVTSRAVVLNSSRALATASTAADLTNGLTGTFGANYIPNMLSITKLANLTDNGVVTTSGGDGTLSVDTVANIKQTGVTQTITNDDADTIFNLSVSSDAGGDLPSLQLIKNNSSDVQQAIYNLTLQNWGAVQNTGTQHRLRVANAEKLIINATDTQIHNTLDLKEKVKIDGSHPSATSCIQVATDGTLSYITTTSLAGQDGADGAQGPQGVQGVQGPQGPQGPAGNNGTNGSDASATTNASDLNSGELSTSLLPSDVIKKPSAANPGSATSVITVATNGTQAYATLDSLHDTAIQAVDQSANNFDTCTHNHVLCGPAAQPFGGAQKPTFRALVEADLPSYLVESTLEQTFYTQTAADALLAAKAPVSGTMSRPTANPNHDSLVSISTSGASAYERLSEFLRHPGGALPSVQSVVELATDGTQSYRAVSDYTNAANLTGTVADVRLSSNIPRLNANLNHFNNNDQNGCEFRFTSDNAFQGEPKWVIERRNLTNLTQRLTVERSTNQWAFRNSHASGGYDFCNNESDVLMSLSDSGATVNPVLTAAAGMTVSGGNLIQQTSPMRTASLGNVTAAGTLTATGVLTANAGINVTGTLAVSAGLIVDGSIETEGDVETDADSDFKKSGTSYGVFERLAQVTPGAWVAVAAAGTTQTADNIVFASGFSTFSSIALKYKVVDYGGGMKQVFLRGAARKSDNSDIAENATMMTIGTNLRPTDMQIMICGSDASLADHHFHSCLVQIQSGGNVNMWRKLVNSEGTDALTESGTQGMRKGNVETVRVQTQYWTD